MITSVSIIDNEDLEVIKTSLDSAINYLNNLEPSYYVSCIESNLKDIQQLLN